MKFFDESLFADLEKKDIEHVSFSGFRTWYQCHYKYMLDYLYEIDKFSGNIHTYFGSAIHESLEYGVEDRVDSEELIKYFNRSFDNILKEADSKDEEIEEFTSQGKLILPEVIPFLDEQFGKYSIESVEEELYEKIEGRDKFFKGFIDLVLRLESGKYVILDWKTTSWGWSKYKKMNFYEVLMQLTMYKHYWSKKHNIPIKDIATGFVLLKRTAKPGKRVELFKTSNGPKTISKGLAEMNKMCASIENNMFPKLYKDNVCKYCQYRGTKYCR